MSELSINERLQNIENDIQLLKKKDKKELKETKEKEPKKEKKPRQKTAYNIFISEFIFSEKERLGTSFKHKDAFSDGAKKWQEQKIQK